MISQRIFGIARPLIIMLPGPFLAVRAAARLSSRRSPGNRLLAIAISGSPLEMVRR
jgi:hypothetical protein